MIFLTPPPPLIPAAKAALLVAVVDALAAAVEQAVVRGGGVDLTAEGKGRGAAGGGGVFALGVCHRRGCWGVVKFDGEDDAAHPLSIRIPPPLLNISFRPLVPQLLATTPSDSEKAIQRARAVQMVPPSPSHCSPPPPPDLDGPRRNGQFSRRRGGAQRLRARRRLKFLRRHHPSLCGLALLELGLINSVRTPPSLSESPLLMSHPLSLSQMTESKVHCASVIFSGWMHLRCARLGALSRCAAVATLRAELVDKTVIDFFAALPRLFEIVKVFPSPPSSTLTWRALHLFDKPLPLRRALRRFRPPPLKRGGRCRCANRSP